jgi:hypothetical protein
MVICHASSFSSIDVSKSVWLNRTVYLCLTYGIH